MRILLSVLIVFGYHIIYCTAVPGWAVLVAGSKEWPHYGDQSSICNMYQILRSQGFPKERIITFMYDDIAHNTRNPRPNEIINRPNGLNLYHDIDIDYRGSYMTKEMLFKVLLGDSSTGGKVVKGGKYQSVFLYYSGLGSEGGAFTMASTTEGLIWNTEFIDILKQVYVKNPYYRMFIAFDAAYAGLMFEELLPTKMNVIAMTATNTDEVGYYGFCDQPGFNTCLTTVFDYILSYFLKQSDLAHSTIFDLYNFIRHAFKRQHPQLYGQLEAGHMPLRAFMKYKTRLEMNDSVSDNNITNALELGTLTAKSFQRT